MICGQFNFKSVSPSWQNDLNERICAERLHWVWIEALQFTTQRWIKCLAFEYESSFTVFLTYSLKYKREQDVFDFFKVTQLQNATDTQLGEHYYVSWKLQQLDAFAICKKARLIS